MTALMTALADVRAAIGRNPDKGHHLGDARWTACRIHSLGRRAGIKIADARICVSTGSCCQRLDDFLKECKRQRLLEFSFKCSGQRNEVL